MKTRLWLFWDEIAHMCRATANGMAGRGELR